MNRLMADMKVEEEERRAQGLPTTREQFEDSDEGDAQMDDSDGADEETKGDRYIDMARARRVYDPAMEADGSKWPRPG